MSNRNLSDTVRKRRRVLAKKEGVEEGILSQARTDGHIDELVAALRDGNVDNAKLALQAIANAVPEGYVAAVLVRDRKNDRVQHGTSQSVCSLKPATTELPIPENGSYVLTAEASPIANIESSFHIVWLGAESSGKSSLIERIRQEEFASVPTTIGLNVTSFFLEGTKIVNCDVSGHKSFRSIWDSLIVGNPDIIVDVIDASDSSALDAAKDVLTNYVLKSENLRKTPIVIAANKQDVEGALTVEQLANKLGLPTLIQDRDWRVIATSAKTGAGIRDMLGWILQEIKMMKGVES
jgi:small GTP-binding protein